MDGNQKRSGQEPGEKWTGTRREVDRNQGRRKKETGEKGTGTRRILHNSLQQKKEVESGRHQESGGSRQ